MDMPTRSADRPPRNALRASWRCQAEGGARERKLTRGERVGTVSARDACATKWNANRVGNAGGIARFAAPARLSVAQISQTYPAGSSEPPSKRVRPLSQIDCAGLDCALMCSKWTCLKGATNWISSANSVAATQIFFRIKNQPITKNHIL